MGKLSKALGKVTKPVAKVLDKLIPNEIKPALPYLAAFAPFYMPPGMKFAQSGIFSNPMFTRALMSGGANLTSQLAQEGSEGDFNPFSVAMASGVGALGADNAGEFFKGMQKGPTGVDQFGDISVPYSDTGVMASISDAIGKGGESAAKFIGEAGKVLRPGEGAEVGLNLETLQAAGVPISQGTGDLAEADARRALRDYENEMANQDQLSLIDDDGRRRAIRAAMTAAGHLEEIIVDTLAELGLKQGGIVGLKNGGRIGFSNGNIAPMPVLTDKDSIRKRLYDPSRGEDVSKTAASEDAPFHQQRVLLEDLDTSGGVESIWGGQSELEEAKSKVRAIDKRSNIVEFEMNLTKRLMEEYDLDRNTADKYASIINFYANYNPRGLSHKEEILERGYTGNDEIILKELENMSNLQSFAHGGVASVLPKGREADYRGGGVIPVGSKERADDVPARLSKNEFVMTADAVRAAGGGSINKGAKRMYNLMHNLEARV